MKLGRCLGEGAQAAVYEWEDGKAVKLFYPVRDRRSEAEYEARVTSAVFASGVRCPAIHGTIEFDGRHGYVMDRVKGIQLIDLIKTGTPVEEIGKRLARLHHQIKEYKPIGLPTHKEWLFERLDRLRSRGIAGDLIDSVWNILESLPSGESLCHGDFHPLNIMVDGDDCTFIDWVGACIGDPLGDVAETIVLLTLGEPPESAYQPLTKEQFEDLRRTLHESYLNEYASLLDITRAELDRQLYDWVTVLALDRIHSSPHETDIVLDFLKNRRPFFNYILEERPAKVTEMIELRKTVGWGIPEVSAYQRGLDNSLYQVCAVKDGKVIGSVRIVGDGVTVFYFLDVIVSSEYQRMGIGTAMMDAAMDYVKRVAIPQATVCLMSAKGKERFYSKYGFWTRPNEHFGPGMMQFWR